MSQPVYLHLFDLSSGMARALSMPLLGKQLDGVWHTSIVFNQMEYYYGAGIQQAPAGATPFGQPLEVIELGTTEVPSEVFQEYLSDLRGVWTPEAYSLFDNNCNNFSDEVANFLVGSGIPKYILDMPKEVLSTAFGQMIAPGLGGVQGRLNSAPPPSSASQKPTPFGSKPVDVTAAVSDSLRAATAAVVADTGIPLDAAAARKLRQTSPPAQKDEGLKRLAETSAALNNNRQDAAELAAGLGRTTIGKEHREQIGTKVASTMGFPASGTRRLATGRSGEIITRLGSGQIMSMPSIPFQSPRDQVQSRPPVPELRRASASNCSIDGPKEPKDGTRAQPGPSHAKIAGLNTGLAYTLERSNSGRTPSAKAIFETVVRQEFHKIMAEGGCSPNEAAAQAIRRAANVSPSAA